MHRSTLLADAASHSATAGHDAGRLQWIDLAKGWCIVLVVTMHATLGVGVDLNSTTWLHAFIAFAKPFRMPDFFMVAGLMAGGVISMPLRRFVDRKILHFAYFYALWLAIVLVAKSGALGITAPSRFFGEYMWSLVEPFSTLWFIHLLPLLYLALRLADGFDRLSILATAIVLHVLAANHPAGGVYAMASVWVGWTTIDSFALFFIYFYVGHVARDRIFQLAHVSSKRPAYALLAVLLWAIAEAVAVRTGVTAIPGVTLLAGFSGALVVVAACALLARFAIIRPLAYCGRNSLAIYLSFVLPMAGARTILLKSSVIDDPGVLASIVAIFAIASPLALRALVATTFLDFLFVRPKWARLEDLENSLPAPIAQTSAPTG